MTNSEKLMQERAKIFADMKSMNDRAETEKRNFNTEEKESYDKMLADTISLKDRYERMDNQEALERELNQSRGRTVDPLNARSVATGSTNQIDSTMYRAAQDHYFRTGSDVKFRAIGSTVASSALLPTDVVNDVIQALNRGSVVKRAGATVIQSSSNVTLPISSVATAAFSSEASTYTSAEPTYTAFAAKAYKVTGKALFSNEILEDAGFDVQKHITGVLLDAMAQIADDKYVIGAGAGSSLPTGIVPTATAKVTSAIAYTATDTINFFYDCPAQYRNDPSFAFIASDTWIAQQATFGMVSGGSTLAYRLPFVPKMTKDGVDTLFGAPVYSSSAVTATPAANALIAVCGAMKYYTIVDRIQNNFEIVRLNELYAETGQVMFLGSYRTDGTLTIPNAARTMKCFTS